MDSYEGRSSDPLSLHKYLYAKANVLNGIDPSGHLCEGIQIGISIDAATSIAANIAYRSMIRSLVFRVGAWAIISATAATTIGGVVAVVAASSTSDQEVNAEIETQIEQAKQQRKKLRFFHYTPRTYEELSAGLLKEQFAALRGDLYYYEAKNKLGVGDPKYVYPVDVDPLVTPVIPRGLVPAGGYGFGGEPQVEFPLGTPPGSVKEGKATYR